ncbi:MAG: PAS domain S-box protein [Bacteroidales bacterium]|nr:PAS domain S-box protein [Bacteroidales bacterium]
MSAGKPSYEELENRIKELEKKVCETPILNLKNEPVNDVEALRDIPTNTENQEFFVKTFEEAFFGIAHVNVDGFFIDVNRKFCEITGYTKQELVKMSFQEITYPDDLHLDNLNISKVLNRETDSFTIEKRYIHKKRKPHLDQPFFFSCQG